MPRSAEPRGMMTAMARISGGDTALRRKQADSKQRITSMVKTESYKENLLESLKDPETAAECFASRSMMIRRKVAVMSFSFALAPRALDSIYSWIVMNHFASSRLHRGCRTLGMMVALAASLAFSPGA